MSRIGIFAYGTLLSFTGRAGPDGRNRGAPCHLSALFFDLPCRRLIK